MSKGWLEHVSKDFTRLQSPKGHWETKAVTVFMGKSVGRLGLVGFLFCLGLVFFVCLDFFLVQAGEYAFNHSI